MRKHLFYIILILFFACKAQHKHDKLGFGPELKKTFVEGPSREDCLEEISKLEDTYLKHVKNLKGYTWNEDIFVASVEISDLKKLNISLIPSGMGCDFKPALVTFTVPEDFSYQENKNEIINDFIWVSKLLRDEKEFKTVEKILSEKKDKTAKYYQDDKFISLFPEIDKNGKEMSEKYLETFMAYFERKSNQNSYSILYFFK